jgi:hypothetical protein
MNGIEFLKVLRADEKLKTYPYCDDLQNEDNDKIDAYNPMLRHIPKPLSLKVHYVRVNT